MRSGETAEEVGLEAKAVRVLGGRVHPQTGVPMSYVACEVISGDAIVGDAEEIAAVAWIRHGEIAK
ncbi:NUDIX hydrolase [Streptomyces parvus]|uniref:NUDIX hydrolase n=1 Tax=Streptomyces parvus TaxID=66428 RepID=UPI0033F2E6B3